MILIIILILLLKNRRDLYTETELQNTNRINRLVRQASRWATAADQDTNPYIANLHATYAMGYLMALRDIYSDTEIYKASGVDIRQVDTHITTIMDSALQKLAVICPEGQPKDQFLAAIAKEGMQKN